jgi:ribosome maturation factor RimP
MRRRHQKPPPGVSLPSVEQIREAVEPVIEEEGFELLKLDLVGGKANALVRIRLDVPEASAAHGVTLDDCSRVSGAVGRLLDGLDLMPWRYHLEVSSPGMDRPLLRERDFIRFRGSRVRLSLREPMEDPADPASHRRNFAGRLAGYDPASREVTLETVEGTIRIALDRIERARLDPVFPEAVRPGRGR